jgi:hypothetical protein
MIPTETQKAPRAIRVVVDLLVDEDIWGEKKAEGCTDKYLVGEVRKTLRIQADAPYRDIEIQTVQILGEGGAHEQIES